MHWNQPNQCRNLCQNHLAPLQYKKIGDTEQVLQWGMKHSVQESLEANQGIFYKTGQYSYLYKFLMMETPVELPSGVIP